MYFSLFSAAWMGQRIRHSAEYDLFKGSLDNPCLLPEFYRNGLKKPFLDRINHFLKIRQWRRRVDPSPTTGTKMKQQFSPGELLFLFVLFALLPVH